MFIGWPNYSLVRTLEKRQRQRDLRARVSAANHLLHAVVRALSGKNFSKRMRRAGAAFENASADELRTALLDKGMAAEIRKFTNPGPEFEEFDPAIARGRRPRVKALAYYLPQFHEIPENNEWWGRGFTEWTNVARGAPRFVGHYQPRIPRDLGFYSLTDRAVLKRQAETARAAGIHGFCFYYYWFGGRRLLEKPLEGFLRSPEIDIDYCLMWANEPWTRRWDGAEEHVLMSQNYDKDEGEAFVDALVRHFQDHRYIRIGGRPLFLVYKPDRIPDAGERFARWREQFRRRHGEEPLIFLAQTRRDIDPASYGLDGAIGFPPHGLTAESIVDRRNLNILDRDFHGSVHSYETMMRNALSEPTHPFPLIPAVMPGWDNDARRPGGGMVVHGASPEKYEEWLDHAARYALDHPVFGESFVAINAWNEWAEAAYLEPDIYYGAAYLNATARALCGIVDRARMASRPVTAKLGISAELAEDMTSGERPSDEESRSIPE
jgi:hypothetical protein